MQTLPRSRFSNLKLASNVSKKDIRKFQAVANADNSLISFGSL
jgi:hypothetical protein